MAEIQDLPCWVWDLLADLIVEEDNHRLYAQLAGTSIFQRYDWCPNVVLEKVPKDVRAAARVIARYRPPVPAPEPASENPEEQLRRLRAVADAAIAWRSQFTKPNDTKFPRRGALIRAVDRLMEGPDSPEERQR